MDEEDRILSQIKQGHTVGHFDTIRQKKDGKLIDVSITVSPVKNKSASIIGASKVARDISEQKQAEENLRQSERKFAILFDKAPFAAALSSFPDGIIMDVNEAFEKSFGHTRQEAIGRTSFELGINLDRSLRKQTITPLDTNRSVRDFEVTLYTRSGDERIFSMNIDLVDISNDKYILSIAQDVTERKHAETNLQLTLQELKRSNAELEQFAYVASHDLQEPLRTITGMVQLLQKKYQNNLDAQADQYIAYMVEAAERLQALINDLLEFSRVDRLNRLFEEIYMNDTVETALKSLSKTIRENNAAITYDDLPKVKGDSSQLIRLLQNLIGNAIKFKGERQPEIHISVKNMEDTWQFSIHDNGIGIEPEYFERIFVIFQRLHTRSEYPGTGIGLSLCKKIVQRHGGQIWVESETGTGTTFHFTLMQEVIK